MQNYFSENVSYYISNLSKKLTWNCFMTISTNIIKKKEQLIMVQIPTKDNSKLFVIAVSGQQQSKKQNFSVKL